MKASEMFPSRYLSAMDLNNRQVIVKIDKVQLEAVGVHCVPLVISEGIAPLLDLVRSRRVQ